VNGTWIGYTSVISASQGIFYYSISPDGNTFFISQFTGSGTVAIARGVGNVLFTLREQGSLAFGGLEQHLFVSNLNNSISEYYPNGTFISSYQLIGVPRSLSALVVDSNGNLAFLVPTGSGDLNPICFAFAASSDVTCYNGQPQKISSPIVNGYWYALTIDQNNQFSFLAGVAGNHLITISIVQIKQHAIKPRQIPTATRD